MVEKYLISGNGVYVMFIKCNVDYDSSDRGRIRYEFLYDLGSVFETIDGYKDYGYNYMPPEYYYDTLEEALSEYRRIFHFKSNREIIQFYFKNFPTE